MRNLAVILVPSDLDWSGWQKVLGPVFGTLVMHGSAARLIGWVRTPRARAMLKSLLRRGVEVEYAVHLCTELLPSDSSRRPELFRMDEFGWRTPDANFCPTSTAAAAIIEKNLRYYAGALRPTTGRYHIFPDDNRPWCHCPQCRRFSPSDQAPLFANILARSLRRIDARATVGYCALQARPRYPQARAAGEERLRRLRAIKHDYRHPLAAEKTDKDRYFNRLAAKLLKFFGTAGSEVIEYWLDASMFSQWQKPMRRIPTSQAVMRADLERYASLGFEHISTIGVWLDKEYVRRFGNAPLKRFVAACKRTTTTTARA